MNTALLELLREQEVQLHQADVRRDPAALTRLLHADFAEIGRSGRAYTRDEMLALLLSEDAGVEAQETTIAEAFSLSELAEGVALLNYRSARRTADGSLQRHTLRSSLWLRTAAGWQLRFHQGTAAAAWG